VNEPDPIPISALEHYRYCPRQCALIHIDGVWVDNEHTLRGTRGHQRADTFGQRHERGHTVIRALPVHSDRYQLVGRADIIEIHDDGAVLPIEYKIGRRHGDTADIQLCAIAFCVEEMFSLDIPTAATWHSATQRRRTVALNPELRSRTTDAITEARALLGRRSLPPAPNDDRCTECQLATHCLPSLVSRPERITHYLQDELTR
jgi:CRISPR-associated exonuclease Cas4